MQLRVRVNEDVMIWPFIRLPVTTIVYVPMLTMVAEAQENVLVFELKVIKEGKAAPDESLAE